MKGNVKRYFAPEFNSELYVSSATRIKALYKALVRANNNRNTELEPLYPKEFPLFNEAKLYGLEIDYDAGKFIVVSSDTVLGMITGVRHENGGVMFD